MSIKEIFVGRSGEIVKLKMFENDTDVTFTERVAWEFSTLPSFLYLSQPFSYNMTSSIQVHLIEDHIDQNFTEFFTNVKGRYNISDRDIALYWLSRNEDVLLDQFKIISLSEEFKTNGIEISLDDQRDIERILEDIKSFTEKKEDAIAENRKKSKIFTDFWSQIHSNIPLPYFQFRKQKSTLFMKTNIKQDDISINTIFSNLVCNSEMVIFSLKKLSDNGDNGDNGGYNDNNNEDEKYEEKDEEDDGEEDDGEEDDGEEDDGEDEEDMMYNENSETEKTTIYKVFRKIPTYKAFPLLIDEIKNYETDHVIFGYMYDGIEDARQAPFQQYSPLSLFFWEGSLYININIDYEKSGSQTNQAYEDLLCQRILNSIANMKVTKNETTYKDIIGVTFLPEISFKTILLSDMIMNDPIFSYFMAVKEFEHSSKKTAGLYTQFFLQGDETGTCSITSKFVTEDDQEIKGLDMTDGTSFIRLRLKSSSQTNIDKFLSIFSKIIGLYRGKEPFIDKEYQGYGVSTDDKFVKVDIREKKTLWDFEPKIFLKGYARSSGIYPRIVEEKEASEIPDSQKMFFPRIPIEGTTQRWYSCDHHESHPYIGVKINNSENKDKVQFLPSCFIADQKKSINMKDYLSGKTIVKKEHIQQIIITTDKFVQNDALGNLPKSLDELLLSLEKEHVIKKHDYFRRGVQEKNHHMSFLECVLKATEKEYRINDELNRLIEHPNMSVASQENPGDTVDEIKEKLLLVRDQNDYMDPRRWIRLCEEVYQFKIILFSRGADDIDPVLTFPYHDFVYLSNQTKRSIIFIYEHYGAERTKKDKFPRCELIVSCEKNEVVPVNCSDVTNLDNFFLHTRTHIEEYQQNQLYQYFYNQNHRHITRIQEFNLPERITKNIIAQAVDSHGKTRAILLKNENDEKNIICLTPPLPPFFTRAFSDDELIEIYRPHHNDDIKQFLTDLPIHSISKKSTKKIDEIHIEINKGIFTIKTDIDVIDVTPMYNMVKNVPTKYPSYSNSSQLQRYFFRKKLAFVMVEYFIYFFSYWCSQNRIKTDKIRSVETMKAFMENVVVDSKNLYIPPTSPSISIDILESNGFLRSQSKFIVDHEETRKRLLYTLLIRFQTKGIKYIEEYYTKKEIDDFYSDISMYCLNEKDTIVIDQLSVLADIDRNVYSALQSQSAKYFMQHNAISTDPVLLIAEKDRKDAKKVSYDWNKNGRIDGDGKDKVSINDSVYVYNSQVDVRNVDDQKNEKNEKEPNAETLVYKKNGTHYMALARL